MRFIGVIDVLGGRAVHARGGRRDLYRPIERVAGLAVDGNPDALARIYLERFGLRELYVADLDAIRGEPLQTASLSAIAAVGVHFWLDAGIRTVGDARRSFDAGASRLVVGLETLRSYAELTAIVRASDPERVAFSLDLRDGEPIINEAAEIASGAPELIAQRAVDAGAGTVIVLDLARVGSGRGVAFDLLARSRAALPGVQLFAAGGVRGAEDVMRLHAIGCDGVLVASALHAGRLDPGYSSVKRYTAD